MSLYTNYEPLGLPNITVTGVEDDMHSMLSFSDADDDVTDNYWNDDILLNDIKTTFLNSPIKKLQNKQSNNFDQSTVWKNVALEDDWIEEEPQRNKSVTDGYGERKKTFLVLASRLGKVYVYRFNKAKSLWLFGPTNPIRKFIIYLITNQIFEFFVILTILTNCVFLAIDNAPEEAEYVFTAIYTTEMILKIIAKGFVLHRFAYLRDPWNWLDFLVVLLGYVTLAPGMVYNFSGIRTFRVLRALRTISAIEGLKTMVNALLKSMRMLSDVLILTAFFICVFALVGLQLFSGHFHNRCVNNTVLDQINITFDSWNDIIKNSSNWYMRRPVCGNNSGTLKCPTNFTCIKDAGPNPNHGFTSYDDFGWALLTSFQLVTLDYWEHVYFVIASTLGPWYIFYFMVVIFFGSFYLINLVLAVVAVSYQLETAHNADLESQYEFLREIASSYSSERRILPKLLYDDPTIDSISSLPCVKQGPSVIILSSNNHGNSSKTPRKTIALGRVYHTNRSTPEKPTSKNSTTSNVLRTSLSRVNSLNSASPLSNSTNSNHSKNINNNNESVNHTTNRSEASGILSPNTSLKTINSLSKPSNTLASGSKLTPSVNPSPNPSVASKKSLVSRVSRTLSADNEAEFPLPYAHVTDDHVTRFIMFRRKTYYFVMSPWFELSVTIFILLNTICLALEYHKMDEDFKKSLDVSNHVFTGIFILEMVLKLIAFSPLGYVRSKWNIFDGLVVLLSIVDLVIELFLTLEDNGDFTIIRSLRLFRVLKLAQSWSTMRLLLSAIGRSLNALGNLTLILGIIVYMFAVVGTHVFGDKYVSEKFPKGQVPVWNFNNFGHSILLIFRVLCGEWIEPLYEAMQATSVWAIGFFMPALVVGNFLVLNLFLALLLNSFADQAMEEELKRKSFMKSKLKWVSSTRKLTRIQNAFKTQNSKVSKAEPTQPTLPEENGNNTMSLFKMSAILLSQKRKDEETVESEATGTPKKTPDLKVSKIETIEEKETCTPPIKETVEDAVVAPPSSNLSHLSVKNNNINKKSPTPSRISDALSPKIPIIKTNSATSTSTKALYKLDPLCPTFNCCICLKKTSSWRQKCGKLQKKVRNVIENKWFENGILMLIVASSFVLVFEDIHLPERPTLMKALDILNIVFCFLFFMEFLLKLIGMGVCGYFKNPWNCLDFLIVTVSVISVVNGFLNSGSNLKTLRSLRTFRALRPLRAVSRWDGMKIVVNSLLKAIPSIGNVLLVCLMFWLIFSILGVQFFGGKFWKCVDASGIRIDASIIPNKTACLTQGYSWKNSNANFDNALNGFLPLLQVATFEGWVEVMRDAVDATKVDEQPVKENNFAAYFYFVVFIIVGAFFILNLFISVIIDNFYRLKKQYDDCGTVELFLTTEQKQWFSTVKKALTKKPKRIIHRPKNYYHGKLFDLVLSAKFETVTMVAILVNIALMMLQHYQQSDDVTTLLRIVNLVFTILFTFELVIRVIALRYQYFMDRWNVFDLLIVVASLVGIVLEYLDVVLHVTPSVLRVARVLRIGRLLRYFNSAKGIRRLLVALVISLPALLNIGALLFLVLFIYSIIGMSNFGYVKKQGAINEISNFETFGNSMLLLFRLATSAGWNEVLDSLMIQPPACDENYKNVPNGNCGTPLIAVLYFVSYILITFLIIVNMYIAVILENFNQAHEQEEIGITDEDIEMFYAVWQLYDPFATQYIDFAKLQYLVANLGPPLGIPFPNKVAVHNLDLPMKENDKIHCVDVLQALLKRVLGNVSSTDTEHYDNMTKTIDKKLHAAFPLRIKDRTKTTTMERLKETKAASVIQKYFREWRKHCDQHTSFSERLSDFENNMNAYVKKNSIEYVFQRGLSNHGNTRERVKSASARLASDVKSGWPNGHTIIDSIFSRKSKTSDPKYSINEHNNVTRTQSAYIPRQFLTPSTRTRNNSSPVCARTSSPKRKLVKNAVCTSKPLTSVSMYSLMQRSIRSQPNLRIERKISNTREPPPCQRKISNCTSETDNASRHGIQINVTPTPSIILSETDSVKSIPLNMPEIPDQEKPESEMKTSLPLDIINNGDTDVSKSPILVNPHCIISKTTSNPNQRLEIGNKISNNGKVITTNSLTVDDIPETKLSKSDQYLRPNSALAILETDSCIGRAVSEPFSLNFGILSSCGSINKINSVARKISNQQITPQLENVHAGVIL